MTITFNEKKFVESYGMSSPNGKSGSAIEFISEDSEYRVYVPNKGNRDSYTEVVNGDQFLVHLQQDHIRGGAKDDHATSEVIFDASGTPIATNQTVSIEEGGPYQIPKWVPGAADVIEEIVGLVAAPESGGTSIAVATAVAALTDAACWVANKTLNYLDRLTDDGGTLNFTAVVCHDMVRAQAALDL